MTVNPHRLIGLHDPLFDIARDLFSGSNTATLFAVGCQHKLPPLINASLREEALVISQKEIIKCRQRLEPDVRKNFGTRASHELLVIS
jgi:hypothetical protein